jgi:hypothetical protein
MSCKDVTKETYPEHLQALRDLKPISTSLNEPKLSTLGRVFEMVTLTFLGERIASFLDVSWSHSTNTLVISSALERLGTERVIEIFSRCNKDTILEWLKSPPTSNDLRSFIRLAVENADLRSQLDKTKADLESLSRSREPSVLPMGFGPWGYHR